MSNLAKAMAHQGKYTEARGLAQGTLQVRERVLGKEHPGTLRSMSDLGWVLFSKHEQFGIGTGRPGKLRDTLQIHEKNLGKNMLTVAGHLTYVLCK